MGRPKIEAFKVRNIEETFLVNRTASARRIWKDTRYRFGAEATPSERKTQDIVQVLRGRDDIEPIGPDPVIEPWTERWRNPAELETLFVLHYTAQSVGPVVDTFYEPCPDFKGLTDRQATWACRLRNLFNLSSRRDVLMLLWFSIHYSDLERITLSLGYESDDIYTGDLDRCLMEWTGRLPAKYPEDIIPDEAAIAEWLFYYTRNVSEERMPMWELQGKGGFQEPQGREAPFPEVEEVVEIGVKVSSALVDLWKQMDFEAALLERQRFSAEGQEKDWDNSVDKIIFETRQQDIRAMADRLYATPEGQAACEQFLKDTKVKPSIQISEQLS